MSNQTNVQKTQLTKPENRPAAGKNIEQLSTPQQPDLKQRLPRIRTLAMLKMEKNFIALEKGYDRQPYLNEHGTLRYWLNRIRQEADELEKAVENWDMDNAAEELADISNIVDYLFEIVTAKRMRFTGTTMYVNNT